MESLKSGTFIFSVINFTVLMVVLVYLLYRPIQAILEQRRQKIAEDLDAAKQSKEMSDRLHKEAQIVLEEAHVEAYEIVEKARNEAERLREQLTTQTKQESEQLRERVRLELERAKINARNQVREEAVNLAILTVQKLVTQKMSAEFNESLINNALGEIEKGENNHEFLGRA